MPIHRLVFEADLIDKAEARLICEQLHFFTNKLSPGYRIIKVRGKNKKPRSRIRIINKSNRPISAIQL